MIIAIALLLSSLKIEAVRVHELGPSSLVRQIRFAIQYETVFSLSPRLRAK